MQWAQANSTLRWPATDNSWEESRNDHFESNFLELQRSYQDGVEIAFRKSSLNTFGQQVEEVHGWMHGTIGGGYASDKGAQGHMWPLEYSAFEPLFWLHHT
jgi:tyrosinase